MNCTHKHKLMRRIAGLPVLLIASLLAGCAAGPDYQRPALDADAGYLDKSLPEGEKIKIGTQQLTYGADVPARWWRLFKNSELDALLQQAIAANPDLAAARAALQQQQELALAAGGVLWPTLSASASAGRGRESSTTGIYDLNSAALEASYELDVFGGNRRSIEAAQATAQSQFFEAEATYLTLTADLTTAVIQEASLREQISATRDIVASFRELLDLMQLKVDVGTAAQGDLLQQKANEAQIKATLPGLIKSWHLQRTAIAVLTGQFPHQYKLQPFTLDSLALPDAIPLSVPSALVQQRPDVRSADALLRAANANIGIAMADMLPRFTLTGAANRSASSFSDIFSTGDVLWNTLFNLSQPIFQGRSLLHNKRAAEAAYRQVLANHKAVTLQAFANVADALRALEQDTQTYNAFVDAEQISQQSLDLAQLQYKVGTGDYTDVLTAQQTYQESRISRATAEADRYLDAVLLFQALGGGWWNRPETLAGREQLPTASAAGNTP